MRNTDTIPWTGNKYYVREKASVFKLNKCFINIILVILNDPFWGHEERRKITKRKRQKVKRKAPEDSPTCLGFFNIFVILLGMFFEISD